VTGAGLRSGFATGIGSLPHSDAAEAAQFVLTHIPDLPSAPQLTARHAAEGMLAQAAVGISGVRIKRNGALGVDLAALDPAAPVDAGLDGEGWVGTRALLDAVGSRRRPIKLQVTGPVTLGIALRHAGAPPALAFAVARKAVAAKARSLVALARQRAPRVLLVVFIDEPGLTAVNGPGFPLPTAEVVDLVSGALASLGPGVVSGLHCCGMTDLRLALQAGPAVVSVPVDDRLAEDGPALASFLEGGGWVAWGAVPTDRPIGDDPEIPWRRLTDLWCELTRSGCDPALLRRQSLITPVCGLAGHGVSQAEWVLRLCRQIGERVEDQAVASRLSMGA
jgi:hypothetical protein